MLFEKISNAVTDAAIILWGECKKALRYLVYKFDIVCFFNDCRGRIHPRTYSRYRGMTPTGHSKTNNVLHLNRTAEWAHSDDRTLKRGSLEQTRLDFWYKGPLAARKALGHHLFRQLGRYAAPRCDRR